MSQLGRSVKKPRKLVIYRGVCRERFRCLRATHLRISPGLYDVSVHCFQSSPGLAALARNVAGDTGLQDGVFAVPQNCPLFVTFRRLPSHGRSLFRSCPRLVLQLSGNIWHTASFSIPVLRTGDWSSFGRLHPTRSRPCWAYRSTRAADRAVSEINGSWPPPGYLGRSSAKRVAPNAQLRIHW